jgi:uncharacterized protein YxeA
MKAYRTLTIIFIVITVLLSVTGVIYSINNYKYDQIEKLIYEAELRKRNEVEQKEKIEYEAEERKKLQNEAYQNEELQYELILQTIKENSDYYVDFSKKFISEFEKFGYDDLNAQSGNFDFYKVRDKLEIVYNSDLLGNINNCSIRNIEGITFVVYKYPDYIIGVDYNAPDPFRQYSYGCFIIYIADEYMNEESIAILSRKIDGFTDENIGNNLFVAKQSVMGYNYVYEVNDPV